MHLADVGAVEVQRVGAGLAFDGVAAVARVPLEAVVAAAEERRSCALVAVDDVVAGAAEQQVGAVAAAERVVAAPPSIVSCVSVARLPIGVDACRRRRGRARQALARWCRPGRGAGADAC